MVTGCSRWVSYKLFVNFVYVYYSHMQVLRTFWVKYNGWMFQVGVYIVVINLCIMFIVPLQVYHLGHCE